LLTPVIVELSSGVGFVTTVPMMLLKEMLRTMPPVPGAGGSDGRCVPAPIEIGPDTSSKSRLEKDMFS